MDRSLVLIIVGFIVIVGAIVAFVMIRSDPTGMLIGGDRDAHGCLVAAGYSYDEDIRACVRSWELEGDERTAAMAAANDVGFADGLTIVSLEADDCEGCYTVVLDRYGERFTVVLEGWVVR